MEGFKASIGMVPKPVQGAIAFVGVVFLGSKLFSSLAFFFNLFILRGTDLRKYGGKGTWAVVTGASDGLGKEFATQLASKGFNIVLISRTQSKLDTLAEQLQKKYASSGIQTKVLAMDFSKNDDADYDKLARLVSGLDIAILVNNVGQSHSIPVPFLETTKDELQDIVTINCLGTLKTTRVIAPGMVRRKRGLILTMGSFGGWMPTPYLATYSGSKAFLQHWNSSLAAELKPSGVDAYLVLSYLVVSAMSKVRRSSFLIPKPDAFVRSALRKIGRGSQAFAFTYTPFWTHAIMQWAVENTIGVGNSAGIWYNSKMHKGIRSRALRKASREAKKA
ncbi:3-ketoacyl-reductase [Grosmannia clavigera kw1407]|uniref:Very-long-chain 3-oxoacyl-CoA reductase n=1 Tax=Grosmannia clavigera (strain kw1407 / UAMH 11150) TaxID=655863 RepID=F0XIN5_GROCL|nr:3-ketoacyl-reductase [Grosmannia clavigera kw1407]EFX02511.1 3-ketoacyl-reductase [Grosmannia clavigera kw1407]